MYSPAMTGQRKLMGDEPVDGNDYDVTSNHSYMSSTSQNL